MQQTCKTFSLINNNFSLLLSVIFCENYIFNSCSVLNDPVTRASLLLYLVQGSRNRRCSRERERKPLHVIQFLVHYANSLSFYWRIKETSAHGFCKLRLLGILEPFIPAFSECSSTKKILYFNFKKLHDFILYSIIFVYSWYISSK